MLVWTGRKNKKSTREYKSKNNPIAPDDLNITVPNTATKMGSEIIAGTMQELDHCHGIASTRNNIQQ